MTVPTGDLETGLDLRLVPPALSAWLAAALVQTVGAPVPGVWWAFALVLTGLLIAIGRGRTGATASRGRPAAVVALGCVVCALGSAYGAWVRADSRATGPLHDLARRGASVEITATVTRDPSVAVARVTGSRRSAGSVIVPARAVDVRAGGRAWRVRQPVLLLAGGYGDVTASAAVWRGLLPSQRLTVNGRLQLPRAGDAYAAVVLVRGPPRDVRRPSPVQRVAGRLRDGLRTAAAGLPEGERGLLPGLVVGDTSALPDSVSQDFRTTGLTHLVAVSGANCGIMIAAALALARRGRLGLRSRAVWASATLVAFVVLARPSPSVLRAAVMGVLGVVAVAGGRPRSAVPALAASVLVLVLVDPTLAVSPGFALSVLATGGLLLLAPGWRNALARRMPARPAEALAVPLAAQVACAPVIAWIAGTVSTTAVPANLLALPAVPPATLLGVLATVTAPFCLPLARVLAQVAGACCTWLITVARVGAHVPGAGLHWSAGLVGAVTLTAVIVLLVAAVRRRRLRLLLVAACVGLVVGRVVVVPLVLPAWPPPGWRLVVCDVGQGDALVLSAGVAGAVLVDAGPDPAALSRCLRRLGVHRLARVVLSHLHADHVEGLPAVLGRLPVGGIEIGPLAEPPEEWARVRGWATGAGVPLLPARAGERLSVGDLRWEVLGPRTVLHGTDSDPNNASLVMRVEAPEMTILLAGDAEPEEQHQLVGRADLTADVLKVPHHGSGRQDPAFLTSAHAQVAVVSVGAGNSYGHPAPSLLETFRRSRTPVVRTDESGSLAVLRRGGRIVTVAAHRRVPVPPPVRRGRVEAAPAAPVTVPAASADPTTRQHVSGVAPTDGGWQHRGCRMLASARGRTCPRLLTPAARAPPPA